MIALAGCAKRNADRELARVLAFIDRRVAAIRAADREAKVEEFYCPELDDIRAGLERLEHRKGDSVSPAVRRGGWSR